MPVQFLPARWSLRAKLAVLVALLVALVSGVQSGVAYWVLRRRLQTEARERLSAAARTAREVLRGFLETQEQRATLLASRTRLRALIGEHLDGARDLQSLQLEAQPILHDAQEAAPGFLQVWIAGPEGRVIVAVDPADLGRDVREHEAFQAGLQGPYLGDPRRLDERSAAVVAAPLGRDERRLGVLMIVVDLEPLRQRLRAAADERPPAREVLVAAPQQGQARFLFARPGVPDRVALERLPAMRAALAGGSGFMDTVDYRGAPVLAVYLPVGYRDWGLVAKVDSELAYAPVAELGRWIGGASLALLVLGAGGAWLVAASFLRPLRALTRAARALGAGELDARAALRLGPDELGELAATFDAMAEALAEHTRDLAERVAARTAALSASEARFRAVSEAALDGIVTADSSGRVTYLNPAAARMFGYPVGELLGGELTRLMPPRLRARHEAGLARYLRTGRPTILGETVELAGLRRDGQEFPLELSLTSYRITEDSEERFMGLVRDITARKAAELELGAAKEEAEASSKAKSEFLANMSHEIRTPMNGVLGMAEVLARTELDPEQRRCLELIRQSAQALLELLSDILDLSRIEAGRLELVSEPFALREVLGEALQELALPAARKGLELTQRVPPEVPEHLIGDAFRLRQVVVNLVSNAIKFTERGQVHVRVRVDELDDRAALLHVEVQDTGIGIPADKLGLVFESFRQVEGSLSRRQGGSGLGLAISRRIVELMGGRIWIESEPGQGTTVHFTARCEPSRAATPRNGTVVLAGVRVLVVDDNATNREILDELLRGWGMAPALAESAGAALDLLRAASAAGRPLQLALLDAMMPGKDGLALAREIRADPALGGLPLILLSSAGQSIPAASTRELRFAATLTKPVRERELRAAVRQALEVTPSPDQDADPPPPDAPSRVLLAEDSPVNREVVRRLLELRGHAVVTAQDGRQAIEAAARERFDLILMDLQMPEVDGFQATATIRAREAAEGRRTRIVALTGHALAGDRERCLAAGMDDYLPKPFRPRDLYQAVEQGAVEQGAVEQGAVEQGGRRAPAAPALADRLGLEPAELSALARAFRGEWRQQLEDAERGLARGDLAPARTAGHALKTSARLLGSEALGSVAEQLETSGDVGLARELLAALARGLSDLERDLEAQLSEAPSRGAP
ncbi:MAG: response regulator [Planctomycetota bacterium]